MGINKTQEKGVKQFVMPEEMGVDDWRKAVAGTYFVRARENAAQTLNHIFCEKLQRESEPLPADKWMKKDFPKEYGSLTSLQQDNFRRLVFHHIPLFKAIEAYRNGTREKADHYSKKKVADTVGNRNGTGKKADHYYSADEMLKDLGCLLKTLDYRRNCYVHANHYSSKENEEKQLKRENELAWCIEAAFNASCRTVKERERYTEKQMEFLQGTGSGRGYRQRKEGKKFVLNEQFYFALTKKDGGRRSLTDFGKFYLCCCFLPSHYVWSFISHANLDDGNPLDEKQNSILKQVLNVCHLRMPQEQRIESDTPGGGLLTDVLGELSRCPLSEVYEHLSPEGQKRFRVPADNNEGETLMVRHDDRFPALALRLIDQLGILDVKGPNDEKDPKDGIRFQQRLGNYRFKFYPKTCLDGSKTLRIWQKEVNGFGKWQELETARRRKWRGKIREFAEDEEGEGVGFVPDTENTQPYITDCTARYNIHNNRIGMTWGLPGGQFLPDLSPSAVEQRPPKCSMSIFDLPELLFYHHLVVRADNIQRLPTPRKVIEDCYDGLHTLFVAAAEGKPADELLQLAGEKGVALSAIPDTLRHFLDGTKHPSPKEKCVEHTQELLKKAAEEAGRRLEKYQKANERVGNSGNKYGKQSYETIRYGSMAQYLGKSMTRWQPSLNDGKDKLTGLNFRTLTASLATSSNSWDKARVRQWLSSAGLLGGGHQHPFLREVVNKSENIGDFYKNYLTEEKKFAEEMSKKLDRKPSSTMQQVPFAKFRAAKWKYDGDEAAYIKDYARRLLHVTNAGGKETDAILLLPDGLFDEPIREAIRTFHPGTELCRMAEEKVDGAHYKHGVSKLLEQYFKEVLNDDSQPFYNPDNAGFSRAYRVTTKLYGTEKGNSHEPHYMQSDELKKVLAKNGKTLMKDVEKAIREGKEDEAVEREAAHKAAARTVRRILNNEKAIRRYKSQDKALFLTAEELLLYTLTKTRLSYYEKNNEQKNNEQFKDIVAKLTLKSFSNDNPLSQIITKEQPLSVKYGGITVTQGTLSLRNLGNTHSVERDPRWKTLSKLLSNTGQTSVEYGTIKAEFASYEENAIKVMQLSQQLENEAYKNNKTALDNPKDPSFWVNDKITRDNFQALLGLHPKFEQRRTGQIYLVRNAFDHNKYDSKVIADIQLPRVAEGMYKMMKDAAEHPEKLPEKLPEKPS